MVQLQAAGDRRSVHTGAETEGGAERGAWVSRPCAVLRLRWAGPKPLPCVGAGREEDGNLAGDVYDAVLGLDAHPTQLDVLRVGRAHLGVVLAAHGDVGGGTGGQILTFGTTLHPTTLLFDSEGIKMAALTFR